MQPHRRQRREAGPEHGFVLIPILAVVISIAVFALVLSEGSTGAVERVGHRIEEVRLEAIADAAIDLTIQDLWSEYKYGLGEDRNTLARFKTYLDAQGIPARAQAAGFEGEFDVFGDAAADPSAWTDVLQVSFLPKNVKDQPTLMGARVHRVDVIRQDSTEAVALRARAVVSFGGDLERRVSSEVQRIYFAGGELFKGFDFALLANNVNCIMCHATVDSAPRYYNADPARLGTFDRVRVGTLQSLKIRTGSAQSVVAGTIYTRGPVMDKTGSLLPGLAGTSVDSRLFDTEWKLVEGAGGSLTTSAFVNAVGDPLPAGGNLYMNYPREAEKQTDGAFPEEFPPIIPDLNDNRLVDAEEYQAVAEKADGTLSGGVKARVSLGGVYAPASLPGSDSLGVVSHSVNGHLVAYGTTANPLVINGRVTVDGDLVVGGVVRGTGVLIARNNVYVVGPLMYQDGVDGGGNRTFGTASDGTPNRLTLGAGANLLVGDFLRGKGSSEGITGDVEGDFNFTLSETTLFGQMEWIRTQPEVVTDGKTSMTVPNPVYDPTHVPRYYVIRPENPVAIFNKSGTYFDVSTLTWLGKEHLGGWSDSSLTYLEPGDPERTNAAVVALAPEDEWLPDAKLIAMWDDLEAAHTGGPFMVDAFLYTNNAIFLQTKKSSAFGGRATINGGLVGADMGILVAGGLRINFDDRHSDVVKLRENKKGEVELSRGVRLR